jgi:hypothetical protein
MGRRGLDWSAVGYEEVAGTCERGNENSGSIKCGEFLDYLMTCWLLRNDSAPLNNNNRLLLVIWSLVNLLCCSFTHWQSVPNHHIVVSITVISFEISDIKRNWKPSSCVNMGSISLRVFPSKEVKMYFCMLRCGSITLLTIADFM